jgi:hypothetical protein
MQIDADGVYDDDLLFAVLGVHFRTLRQARQEKQIRFTRKGRRILYLGRWVLDWLAGSSNTQEKAAPSMTRRSKPGRGTAVPPQGIASGRSLSH